MYRNRAFFMTTELCAVLYRYVTKKLRHEVLLKCDIISINSYRSYMIKGRDLYMKLVIGLGNPGVKYDHTRHNVGFMVVDQLVSRLGGSFDTHQAETDIYITHLNGEKVIIGKPQTYMNLSGRAVASLMHYYRLDTDDLLVIYDDLDLPVGTLRLREQGSAGGHNGIKDIIRVLDTKQFPRIRVGIDRPKGPVSIVDYVLSRFLDTEIPKIEEGILSATDAALFWVEGASFKETMNRFNAK